MAIATAPGKGGIGIVRLSGPSAQTIAAKIFHPREGDLGRSHLLVYGALMDSDSSEMVDHGFAAFMAAPHTYTGENVVEFQVHGSPVVLDRVVRLCLRHGAVLAEPGEFTKRAFLNGKIDLVQAEAVAELIQSESEAEARAAQRRLSGKLSSDLQTLREQTVAILAECEADIDFPEEDIPLPIRQRMIKNVQQLQILTSNLRATYQTQKRLRDGFTVVLFGRPNVGKSKLFNALLEMERAIVTPIPGTTRDVLREELLLSGRRVRLVDTAGLRDQPENEVEKEGMDRTREEASKGQLRCLVVDSTVPLHPEEKAALKWAREHGTAWIIRNKVDLPHAPSPNPGCDCPVLEVSALRGDGISNLRQAIGRFAREQSPEENSGGIANDRQLSLLDQFGAALGRAKEAYEKGSSSDLVAIDLRDAHRCISRLVGQDEGVEDVLHEVFTRFCIGK